MGRKKQSALSDADLDDMARDDVVRAYKSLRQSRDAVRKENKEGRKFNQKLAEAVTHLSVEGAAAFRIMAETCGLERELPVIEALAAFDSIAHPQWQHDDLVLFPRRFDLNPRAQHLDAGDADAAVNSPLSELLETLRFGHDLSKIEYDVRHDWIVAIVELLSGKIDQVKADLGITYKEVTPRALDAEKCDHCDTMSWVALDIAQDMEMGMTWLRRDLRYQLFRDVSARLYQMAFPPQTAIEASKSPVQVKVMGESALRQLSAMDKEEG